MLGSRMFENLRQRLAASLVNGKEYGGCYFKILFLQETTVSIVA